MPAPKEPPHNAIENRLLNVAKILDEAVAAVNQAIADLRSSEEEPDQEGKTDHDF